MECIHFEAIVHAQWNLRRCRINEAVFLASGPDAFLDPNQRKALNTLSIYAARHERALHRATKELKALQFERALRTNCGDDEGIEPSPLVETARARRVMLAEMRAKIGLKLPIVSDTMADTDEPSEPISFDEIDRLLQEEPTLA
jgi:hypothetical protein